MARTLSFLAAAAMPAPACSACRPIVAARVFNAAFVPTCLLLLLPVGLILAIGLGLAWGPGESEPNPEDSP